MSFLNPVNEPVLRFSSTDADAPQIDYAARTAGDVKAVLKACLVTGYGDKASAGWSVVNEVDHVCEFVSPSAAMSDYRLGIDDTSASSTTWYYQYQDARVNPSTNALSKNTSFVDRLSPSNRWDLIATARGFYFIERVKYDNTDFIGSSITYFGPVKSCVTTTTTVNIAWWCMGFSSTANYGRPTDFFRTSPITNSQNVRLDSLAIDENININKSIITNYAINDSRQSYIDMASDWYYAVQKEIVAQQVGCVLTPKIDTSLIFDAPTPNVGGRDVLVLTPSTNSVASTNYIKQSSRVYVSIYLDYWEY